MAKPKKNIIKQSDTVTQVIENTVDEVKEKKKDLKFCYFCNRDCTNSYFQYGLNLNNFPSKPPTTFYIDKSCKHLMFKDGSCAITGSDIKVENRLVTEKVPAKYDLISIEEELENS